MVAVNVSRKTSLPHLRVQKWNHTLLNALRMSVVRCFWGAKINTCSPLLKKRLKLDDAQRHWSSLWPQNSCFGCHLPFQCDESALMVCQESLFLTVHRSHNIHFHQCRQQRVEIETIQCDIPLSCMLRLCVKVHKYFLSADEITKYTATGTWLLSNVELVSVNLWTLWLLPQFLVLI